MKVLYITNMYPVPDYIYFGIHVREQIDAIQSQFPVENEVYFINGRLSKWNYFKSISEIRSLVNTKKFDVIHVHYGLSALFLMFYKPQVPVVVTLHSGELFQKKGYINHLLQKNITLSVIRNVEKVIVLNDDMIRMLAEHEEKLVKIPCGTDLDYFKETPVKTVNKKFTIGFPGNKARPEKNYKLFQEIVDRLRTYCEVEVIEFHNMKRDDVVANLNKIDLLLMTSTIEGSPQIVKEGLACNKAIISTAVGDVKDLLRNVVNCYVIDSFDPEEFVLPAKRIASLPPENRKSDGREHLVKIGLDAQNVSKTVYKLYEQLV
ncbi:glycosyltransferase family 4 protein [Dyadobacter luticola]|uniref:Glycosyltransferase family 4 protein n=1 Tax=Dyadobacter luticola TaxID=1979387 RepID=A0A5R9L4C1_9BACT|nr:glycosyltransferase family 4 protein [Dyadobacter luticola]TLV03227.1 glycosyltransferase family 4 protein [Dyadobacter luticola]